MTSTIYYRSPFSFFTMIKVAKENYTVDGFSFQVEIALS